jgi:hypothetical protein
VVGVAEAGVEVHQLKKRLMNMIIADSIVTLYFTLALTWRPRWWWWWRRRWWRCAS